MKPKCLALKAKLHAILCVAGLSFCGFEFMKSWLLRNVPDLCGKPCPRNDGQLVLVIPAKLLCGGLAGTLAQTVS